MYFSILCFHHLPPNTCISPLCDLGTCVLAISPDLPRHLAKCRHFTDKGGKQARKRRKTKACKRKNGMRGKKERKKKKQVCFEPSKWNADRNALVLLHGLAAARTVVCFLILGKGGNLAYMTRSGILEWAVPTRPSRKASRIVEKGKSKEEEKEGAGGGVWEGTGRVSLFLRHGNASWVVQTNSRHMNEVGLGTG